MSTRISKIYGKDYHFYYDYKDMKNHLNVGTGKRQTELKLPAESLEKVGRLCTLREFITGSLCILNKCEKDYYGHDFTVQVAKGRKHLRMKR